MTSFNVSTALYFNDAETINETFKSVKQNKDLRYIVVSDKLGIVSSHNLFNSPDFENSLLQNKDSLYLDNELLHISKTIKINNQEIGNRLYVYRQ